MEGRAWTNINGIFIFRYFDIFLYVIRPYAVVLTSGRNKLQETVLGKADNRIECTR